MLNKLHFLTWALWIGGSLLVVGSWIDLVPVQVGWAGYVIAVAGTLLNMNLPAAVEASAKKPKYLCETCRLNHGLACWRRERPRAKTCPDYDPLPK